MTTRVISVYLALLLAACVHAQEAVPSLTLSVEWPEQKIEKNVIHKTRPPRGGVSRHVGRSGTGDRSDR